MKKIWETIQKISGAISAFAMISVVVLIFINVVCRYFLDYSIPWCEELTRYMFIAVIFLTLNIMVSQGAALKVDIIDNYVMGTPKFIIDIIDSVLTIIALGVFTVSGLKLVQIGTASVSPAMHIPMQFVYAIPVSYTHLIISF